MTVNVKSSGHSSTQEAEVKQEHHEFEDAVGHEVRFSTHMVTIWHSNYQMVNLFVL